MRVFVAGATASDWKATGPASGCRGLRGRGDDDRESNRALVQELGATPVVVSTFRREDLRFAYLGAAATRDEKSLHLLLGTRPRPFAARSIGAPGELFRCTTFEQEAQKHTKIWTRAPRCRFARCWPGGGAIVIEP
jgi:hypothetical protein